VVVYQQQAEAIEFGTSNVVVARVGSFAPLSPEEDTFLHNITATARDVPAGTRLSVEGEPLQQPGALLSGWACTARTLPDGRRQIFGFLLPGDIFGLRVLAEATAPRSILTLTACRIADASELKAAITNEPERFPNLARACAISADLEEAYLLDHVVRLGRQTAYERIAHLLLELAERLKLAGLTSGTTAPMPLTQEVIADALGLSLVHVNRTLQQLRRDHLIEFRASSMNLIQIDQLKSIATFRPPRIPAAS
jgi:CRP-like cAMP-binding protein